MLSRKLKTYTGSTRHAAHIFLLGILACSYAPPIPAAPSSRMGRSILPVPGYTGNLMNLTGVRRDHAAVTSQQDPLFESSWTGRTDEIVAQSRYGSVSSRDLYLWMLLRESPNKAYLIQQFQKAKLPKQREELAKALRVEIDEFIFTNYVVPKIMPAAPPDAVYDLKRQVYTLPVWQTVFLQSIVQPSVTITEADRQKYLQEHTAQIVEPERLRTRYIFMASPETSAAEDQDHVEVTMDELRTSILRGDTTFANAARASSQAPSASNGGEIPPFQHGELFFLFENAASSLEPGGISPVFRGPRGYYMVQLIDVMKPKEPSLSDPEQAKLVDEGLSRQVLRSAYEFYLRDMLLERRRITEKPAAWDSIEDCEILGEVCNFHITKGEFRSAWPDIEGNDLRLRTEVIAPQLRTILEREAMAQEVKDLGFGNDPMLERAGWMACNIIRRDAWLDQLRAALPISEQLARSFWNSHQDLFTPMALKRVIKLTMTPTNNAPLPVQTRMELDKVLAGASGQPVPEPVTVAKRQEQDEERSSLIIDQPARTQQAIKMLTAPPVEPNFYTNDFTTGSLQGLIESEPVEVPSLQGEPAPGLESIPGPAAVTTDSLDSLVAPTSTPAPTPTEPNDIPTTISRGGAASGPVSGGKGPDGIMPDQATPIPPDSQDPILPQAAITPAAMAGSKVYGSAADESVGPPIIRNEVSPVILPATRPRGGAVPVGHSAPAISPALTIQETPNIRHQLAPPPTSDTPYNPDWFYLRRDATGIGKIVGQYTSSDWLLTTTDLGFIYVPDLADAPRKLDTVPVGAFSRPVIVGQNAVSWYIEEARKVEKQPFDEIKTQVYDVYRNVQVDETVSRTYNSELEKAKIDYKF